MRWSTRLTTVLGAAGSTILRRSYARLSWKQQATTGRSVPGRGWAGAASRTIDDTSQCRESIGRASRPDRPNHQHCGLTACPILDFVEAPFAHRRLWKGARSDPPPPTRPRATSTLTNLLPQQLPQLLRKRLRLPHLPVLLKKPPCPLAKTTSFRASGPATACAAHALICPSDSAPAPTTSRPSGSFRAHVTARA